MAESFSESVWEMRTDLRNEFPVLGLSGWAKAFRLYLEGLDGVIVGVSKSDCHRQGVLLVQRIAEQQALVSD